MVFIRLSRCLGCLEAQSESERTSLVAHRVSSLLAIQETWVQFLGQEDPLEKVTATHCSIFAWRIPHPWTEEPCGLQSVGSQRLRHNRVTNTFGFSGEWNRCALSSVSMKEEIFLSHLYQLVAYQGQIRFYFPLPETRLTEVFVFFSFWSVPLSLWLRLSQLKRFRGT